MSKSLVKGTQPLIPGLAGVLAIAVIARMVQSSGALPREINDVILAILMGLAIRNLVGVPAALQPGIKYALQRILRLAIILLGATLSFATVVQVGLGALSVVVICITAALLLTTALGRLARLPFRLVTLIGVGTAICGNSAIVATAPVIKAKDEEVSFAVATITLFGTLAVFVYPMVGRLLGLPEGIFGAWAGTAVNDTSQVVAAGFAYSAESGQVATVVKLTRNALMAPVIVIVGLLHARAEARRLSAAGLAGSQISLFKVFPQFVLGFLALAVLNTIGVFSAFDGLGLLPTELSTLFGDAAKFLILVALAGVGLGTNLKEMRRMGLSPFLLGLFVSGAMAVMALLLVQALRVA